jgi:hypothetical protein
LIRDSSSSPSESEEFAFSLFKYSNQLSPFDFKNGMIEVCTSSLDSWVKVEVNVICKALTHAKLLANRHSIHMVSFSNATGELTVSNLTRTRLASTLCFCIIDEEIWFSIGAFPNKYFKFCPEDLWILNGTPDSEFPSTVDQISNAIPRTIAAVVEDSAQVFVPDQIFDVIYSYEGELDQKNSRLLLRSANSMSWLDLFDSHLRNIVQTQPFVDLKLMVTDQLLLTLFKGMHISPGGLSELPNIGRNWTRVHSYEQFKKSRKMLEDWAFLSAFAELQTEAASSQAEEGKDEPLCWKFFSSGQSVDCKKMVSQSIEYSRWNQVMFFSTSFELLLAECDKLNGHQRSILDDAVEVVFPRVFQCINEIEEPYIAEYAYAELRLKISRANSRYLGCTYMHTNLLRENGATYGPSLF